MFSSVLGLDVGGANLKAAHSSGIAISQPFELWKTPNGLTVALNQLLSGFPSWDLLAVTMTGELCDCFESKRQGVLAILDAVEAVARGLPVRVWQNDGQLVDLASARSEPLSVAAANWLALATYAGRFAPSGAAILMDIGSTTTDIVPLLDGKPVPRGRTDPDRLSHGELVYTGVQRTPLCALLQGRFAAEFFATTLDVYLMLGELHEDAAFRGTADGRGATMALAHSRLARMLCADAESCDRQRTYALALEVQVRQVELLTRAIIEAANQLPQPPTIAILTGSGEFLAGHVLGAVTCPMMSRISLATSLGPKISGAACAYALAVLAAERLAIGE